MTTRSDFGERRAQRSLVALFSGILDSILSMLFCAPTKAQRARLRWSSSISLLAVRACCSCAPPTATGKTAINVALVQFLRVVLHFREWSMAKFLVSCDSWFLSFISENKSTNRAQNLFSEKSGLQFWFRSISSFDFWSINQASEDPITINLSRNLSTQWWWQLQKALNWDPKWSD